MDYKLYEQLRRLNYLLHRYYGHGGDGGYPLHGQGRILSILKLKPEIPQQELGYMMGIRKQSLTELLSKLENKKYIVREPSVDDRRAMIVKLTDAGAEATEKMAEKPEDRKDIFSIFNEKEQEQYSNYMVRLIGVLEKEIGENPEDYQKPYHHCHHNKKHRKDGIGE